MGQEFPALPTTQAAPPYAFVEAAAGRVALRDGFAWNDCDAYLFDIDGTLLRETSRLHSRAFSIAAERVTGHPLSLDGVLIHGSTDPVILRDAIQRNSGDPGWWQPFIPAILRMIAEVFAEGASQLQIEIMPGVEAILRYLHGHGKLLGVATGNLESIGWAKIRHAGLAQWFAFGGFSDGHDSRPAMIAAAADAARALAGPRATVCVLGDTPHDIAAARANRLPVVAVATGRSPFDLLLSQEPEVCATNFAALLAATPDAAAAGAIPAAEPSA
jgi:phosphoglycolate phosphatase